MSTPHDAAPKIAPMSATGERSGLWFEVLGPLQAWVDGRQLPLGGARQRRLLAALLADANEVVSADRLIDVVWGDTGPDEGAAALAKVVYRLRGVLGSNGELVTQPPGYRLVVDGSRIDANQFATLVRRGQDALESDPAGALDLIDAALALWRGPAWAEFADDDFARPLVTRLDGLRAVAVESRLEAMLGLGRYEAVIPELEQAIAEYPLRERPRAQLMRALYLCGRHADALNAYRIFREQLADEMGLEPSAELRTLEADILQQRLEPGIARSTAAPPPQTGARIAGLPPFDEPFVGRAAELGWLDDILRRADDGAAPVVAWLAGEAGIGKSALVRVFGQLAYARDWSVVYTRCSPVLGAAGQLREVLGAPAADAAALRTALDAFGRGRQVLVVVDDADRSPDDAYAVLAELAAAGSAAALCLIGTGRIAPPNAAVPVRELAGLSRDDVSDLLTAISGTARPPELVESVWLDSRGVPALVTAVGRELHHRDITTRAEAAMARAERARTRLDQAHDDLTRDVLARVELAQPDANASPHVTCPYKGLAPFDESDATFFYGRERLVGSTVARLAVDRFLAVLGPSGGGKSSLVAAGLLPALALGGLPGSERWRTVLFRPGGDPMSALRAAITQQSGGRDYPGLAAFSQQFDRVVLVIDQFEEVFTACQDLQRRTEFIALLTSVATDSSSRVSIVVVMRADYYGACAAHPELAHLAGRGQLLVPPMTDSELRRAVTEPARRAGLTVEPDLVDAVVQDADAQTGALPMISTALLETWAARSGTTLTLSGYLAAGGVRGAVARLAESVWAGFDITEQVAARRILLRLADAHSAGTDVRRRAARTELVDNATDELVLGTLIERRLLTASEDHVEVAHEALLREWPRLRGWLDDDREGRRLHRQLGDAALGWDEGGRDDADLYRGVRLHAARDWLATHPDDANVLEQQFVAASEAFDTTSLRAARRTARRLRVLAAGLAVFLVAAVIGAVIAVEQRSTARRQALQADVNRLATLASTMSGEQRDLALLLGATAYELQPSDQDAGALQTALMDTPPGLDRIIRYPGASTLPHLDAAGHLLAVPDNDGVVVYNVLTGKQVAALSWPTPRQYAVFSGDDRFVAAGGSDGTVAVWNLATRQPSGAPLHISKGGTVHPVFDPRDDNRLYVITGSGALTAWDRSDIEHPRPVTTFSDLASFPAPGTAPALTVSADGRTIAAGGHDNGGAPIAAIWDTATHARLHDYAGAIGGALSTDGTTLPFGHLGATVLLDVRTGRVTHSIPGTNDRGLSVLSPDGSRIAVAGGNGATGSVTIYDVASRRRVWHPITLPSTSLFALGFTSDNQLVTTTAGEAMVWTIGAELPPLGVALDANQELAEEGTFPSIYPVFIPHMRNVLTLGGTAPHVHDPTTGRVIGTLKFGGDGFASSPDGRLLLDGGGRIWNIGSGKEIGVLPNPPEADFSYVGYISWSPVGHRVAVDLEGTGYVWDVSDPRRPSTPRRIGPADLGVIQYLTFMPDGRILVVSHGSSRLSLIDLSSNRIVWTRTLHAIVYSQQHRSVSQPAPLTGVLVREFAASPDGSTLALDIGNESGGTVVLLDLNTGAVKASLSEPTSGGVGYLNHGRWLLVTADTPGPTAQLYNASTLQPFGVPMPTDDVDQESVSFDPDGTRFAQTIDSDVNRPNGYDPLLWTVDPASWLHTACRIAGRNLTQAEWHQYLPDRSYRTTCPEWPAGS